MIKDGLFSYKNISLNLVTIMGRKGKDYSPPFKFYKGNVTVNRSAFLELSMRHPKLLSPKTRDLVEDDNKSQSIWMSIHDFPSLLELVEAMDEFMNNVDEYVVEVSQVEGETIRGVLPEVNEPLHLTISNAKGTRSVIAMKPTMISYKNQDAIPGVLITLNTNEFKIKLDETYWRSFSFMVKNAINNFTSLSYQMTSMYYAFAAGNKAATKNFTQSLTEEDT